MTQNETVHAHLKKHGKITSWMAIKRYKITRVGARVFDLIGQGIPVKSKLITRNGKTFSEYSL